MAVQAAHRRDHGRFCTWQYSGPGKRARGFWHGDNQITQPLWAYALRSTCGTFWQTSRAKGGFQDEAEAIRAAEAAISCHESR
jgi:hypothetical protein